MVLRGPGRWPYSLGLNIREVAAVTRVFSEEAGKTAEIDPAHVLEVRVYLRGRTPMFGHPGVLFTPLLIETRMVAFPEVLIYTNH